MSITDEDLHLEQYIGSQSDKYWNTLKYIFLLNNIKQFRIYYNHNYSAIMLYVIILTINDNFQRTLQYTFSQSHQFLTHSPLHF